MVCFTLIMQIICTIFLIIRSETTLIRSAVPIKIVLKRRAKQLEKATRKQGEWESKEFRAAQGRKNHSAVVPAPENDMEKCRSGGTPKLFDRTVGVRTIINHTSASPVIRATVLFCLYAYYTGSHSYNKSTIKAFIALIDIMRMIFLHFPHAKTIGVHLYR